MINLQMNKKFLLNMQPLDDVVGASLVDSWEGATDGAAFEASDEATVGASDKAAFDASEVIIVPSSTVVPTSSVISPCLLFI